MTEPWDVAPMIPPGLNEQRTTEIIAAWPQRRVELVQERLKLLGRYQETPGAERSRLRGAEGRPIWLGTCVYLMRCPSITSTAILSLFEPGIPGSVFKIGHTRDLRKRTRKHRRDLDSLIEHHTIYYTPIPRRILERFLLRHFHYFRVRTDLSDELFDLPQEEVDGFKAVAQAIDLHLLAIEVLRLEALLSRFKAECS